MEGLDTGIRIFVCRRQSSVDFSGFQEAIFHIYYIVTEEKKVLTPDRGATDFPQITGMDKFCVKNAARRKIH